MPSQTYSRKPNNRSTKRSRWMRLGAFALVCSAGSLWLWNDASTANPTRENRGFNRVTGSSVEPAQYVPGEVIVKFQDSASKATVAAAHALAGGQTMKSIAGGADRFDHLKLGKGENVEDVLEKYRQSPAVEYAEPNYVHQLTAVPNDTQFASLWGLHNTGQNVNGTAGAVDVDIDAPEAWDITTGSSNVIIAVIDSGIAYDHPDLAANMWRNPGETPNDGIDNDNNGYVDDVFGYDFRYDDSEPMDPINLAGGNVGHGTHVAGTIGAVGNNNSGITGVMHRVKLMALKSGGADNGLTSAAIIEAVNYAISKGARAINASFTREGQCSSAEYAALRAANAAGVMVLAAAGNTGSDNDVRLNFPSGYSVATSCGPALPNVISVAAITQTGAKASFSNFGAESVQIAAPGANINSTKPTINTTDLLFHNFDSNPTGLGYTFSGINNSWGFTDTASFSAPMSMTDSPTGNYRNNTDAVATGPIFSTAGKGGCRLESRLRLETQNNFDGIQTDVSGDGGVTWFTESGWTGSTSGAFQRFTMAELPDRKSNVQYRFSFISDGTIVDDGVYLDDVRAYCVTGTPSATTDYQFLQGTSQATPHVTGVVGLLLSVNPNLTVAQIRNAILNTGNASALLNGVVSTGRRLNAFNALNSIATTFTVMVSKSGTGTGRVTSTPAGVDCGGDCNEPFAGGMTVTLTAIPNAGSVFAGWSGGGCSGTGVCVVSTTATVTATFNLPAPPPFTVTVNKNGTGTGTVTANPAGINCGIDCTETYPGGTRVTLTATADAGSVFTAWSGGGCAGASPCVVSATATVTATFTVIPVIPPPITVTVNKNGTGAGTVTSNPTGINCGGDCTGTYPGGTTVTLTPSPSAGSLFAGWSGGCTGTGLCQVASTVTVTATFNVLPPQGTFTVTILKGGTGTGKVVSVPTGIDCGAICSFNFFNNTTVTLTATADGGSTFTGWSGNGCTGTGSCVVNTAASVTATFDAPVSNVATSSGSPGGGGCTITQAGTNDALMPIILLMTIGTLIWRGRRRF